MENLREDFWHLQEEYIEGNESLAIVNAEIKAKNDAINKVVKMLNETATKVMEDEENHYWKSNK